MRNPFAIFCGFAEDFPIQIRLKGAGAAARLASDDILRTAFYPFGNGVSACSPAISYYTANSTQTGYDQGQVMVSFSLSDTLAATPTVPYILFVTRARAAAPTVFTPIAALRFNVNQPQMPRI